MEQAMIFAAGLGTRLKPLTDKKPKALVEVGGEPLLKRVIFRLKDAGYRRIVVNVHHFASQIVEYLHENGNFGLDIRISDESECLLDTGGGIKNAYPLFDPLSPILIHNVDILSNVDLKAFYAFSANGGEGRPLYDAVLLVSDRKTKRYLLFSPDGRMVGWMNIETGEIRTPYDWVPSEARKLLVDPSSSCLHKAAFAGIHVVSPTVFKAMEPYPDKFSIMDFYIQNCSRLRIHGYLSDGLKLMDVGKPETLRDAASFLEELKQ